MIRIFLVDDDNNGALQFAKACESTSSASLVGVAKTWVEAKESCERLIPDLIVVNWRLPGQTVEKVLDFINSQDVPPVLCVSTPFESDAWEAFRAGAWGFLVKPYRVELFQNMFNRLVGPNRVREVLTSQSGRREFITIKSRRGLTVVPIDDIRYFYADHKYVMAVTPEGERVLDEPLRHLETRYGNSMLRVHRNAIVSVAHVCGLKRLPSGQFQVELSGIDGGPIVSRRHLAQVRARLASM